MNDLEQRINELEKKIAALEVQVQKLLEPKNINLVFKSTSDKLGWDQASALQKQGLTQKSEKISIEKAYFND